MSELNFLGFYCTLTISTNGHEARDRLNKWR